MDVRTLMRRAAQHYSDYEAIVHNDIRLTFAQAWERGARLANGLLVMGPVSYTHLTLPTKRIV